MQDKTQDTIDNKREDNSQTWRKPVIMRIELKQTLNPKTGSNTDGQLPTSNNP